MTVKALKATFVFLFKRFIRFRLQAKLHNNFILPEVKVVVLVQNIFLFIYNPACAYSTRTYFWEKPTKQKYGSDKINNRCGSYFKYK